MFSLKKQNKKQKTTFYKNWNLKKKKKKESPNILKEKELALKLHRPALTVQLPSTNPKNLSLIIALAR